jgi:hypothetical protein
MTAFTAVVIASQNMHCLKCLQGIEGKPVWKDGLPLCKDCANPKSNLPVVEVEPNPKCKNCWGRGRVRTQSTRLPGSMNVKNVKIAGGVIRVQEICGCVRLCADKIAKARGLEKGTKYQIKIKGDA